MSRRIRRVLSPESRFDVLWAGQAVSQFGDYLAFFSVPLFVVHLANAPGGANSGDLGIWYALDAIPSVLLGLVGGVLIDRVQVRWLMILADLGRAVMFLVLAFASTPLPIAGSRQGLGLVFLSAVMLGSLATVFNNALYTLVPSIVAPKALASANSRLSATQNLAFALGPAVAGVLVASAGFWLTFLVNAATFAVSATSLLLIGPVPKPARDGKRPRVIEDLMNGLRYVWGEPRLRLTTIAAAGGNLVIGFIESTLVLTATRVVGAGEDGVGLIYSSLGLGAIAGAIVAPTMIRLIGLGKTLVIGFITFGLGLTLFANIAYSLIGLGQIFVGFAGLQLLNIPLMTIRQRFTPTVMLGRVLSATRSVGWASLPIGALLGTALSDGFDLFVPLSKGAPLMMVAIGLALIPTIVWSGTRSAPTARLTESPAQ